MTAVWPESLPPPLRTVDIKPGNNTEATDQISGRRIVRNWGHKPADQVTVQFRIRQTQEADFKNFWHRVGMDVTWFEADWLTSMLYPNHKARILGYPRRKGISNIWMDFSVTLLVVHEDLAVDADPWLSAGTGVPLPPSPDEFFFAISSEASPYVLAYPWHDDSGVFGAKFSNPATLPAGVGAVVKFSPEGDYILVQHQTTPGVSAYPWLPGGGFGTKLSDPSPVAGPTSSYARAGISFTPESDYVAIAHEDSTSVYAWSGGFGTRASNPATLPAGADVSVTFSPEGDYIAIGSGSSPRIQVYPWTGAFGTKLSDPGSIPPNAVGGVAFSPDGAFLALAYPTSSSNPWVVVYNWSNGFGSQVSAPSPALGSASGETVTFSFHGDYIAAGNFDTSPYIVVYPWVGGFGTKVSNPEHSPAGPIIGEICFSPSDNFLAMPSGGSGSPFFTIYAWSGGFGGKVSAPITIPSGNGTSVAFGVQEGS